MTTPSQPNSPDPLSLAYTFIVKTMVRSDCGMCNPHVLQNYGSGTLFGNKHSTNYRSKVIKM